MSLDLGLGIAINSVKSLLSRFFGFFWTDHNGNNITDHNGNNIEFRTRRQ